MAGRTIRGWVATGLIAGSAVLALPASAHYSSYCDHGETWDKSSKYTWLGTKYRSGHNTGTIHYHDYRHWNFYPYSGALTVMHGDVTKAC